MLLMLEVVNYNNQNSMSNKNIMINRYKWQNHDPVKSPGLATIVRDDRKIQTQFSPKNIPNQVPKYFKTNAIYRHASEEEFKKYAQPSLPNQEHVGSGVEEQYYNNHKMTQKQTKSIPQMQSNVELQPQSTAGHIKNISVSTSNQHSNNRRVSPNSNCSPGFFKSKQKMPQKQYSFPIKITINNFKKLAKLGQGKFGKVYLVQQINTGFMMALKVLEKKKIIQDDILQQFIRQLKIQAFLNHPNIICVYGFFHDDHAFYTLLELGCDGQLYNVIAQHKHLTEQATSFITKNLLQAVNCMHGNHILHRDIKPENIVLIMGNVKLCDFGWAVNKVKKEELRSTFCGTPLYLSPELLKGQRYDEKVDLWAIGILAYELVIGNSPFEINQQHDLIKILTQEVKFPKNKKISPQFQQFIHHILNKNPKERLSSSELLCLPFIRKYQEFQTCEQLCG